MQICLSVLYSFAQYWFCTCDVFIADVSSGECDTGDHRLVDGTDYDGRVEVCVDGEWGSVCSINSWGVHEATVACRATYGTSSGGHHYVWVWVWTDMYVINELSVTILCAVWITCPHGIIKIRDTNLNSRTKRLIFTLLFGSQGVAIPYIYGNGTGPILVVQTICEGNENSLLNCHHGASLEDCDHSFDAGVRCIAGG